MSGDDSQKIFEVELQRRSLAPRRAQGMTLATNNDDKNAIMQLRKQHFDQKEADSKLDTSAKQFIPARPSMNPLSAANANALGDFASQKILLNSDIGLKSFGFGREEINATTYYEGQFKYSKRWGDGTLHDVESGSKYVGQFMQDRFHGHGHHQWPDGTEYIGQWQNGEKSGKGKFISADYLTYTGQWVRGRRHGYGTQVYANGDKYEGNWETGVCSGRGVYTWAGGSVYKGSWLKGRYDGTGVYIGADSVTEHRIYRNGMLEKRDVSVKKTEAKARTPRKFELPQPRERVVQEKEAMQSPTRLPPLAPTAHPVKYCREELHTARGSLRTHSTLREGTRHSYKEFPHDFPKELFYNS